MATATVIRNREIIAAHGFKSNTSKERPVLALANGTCMHCKGAIVEREHMICWNRKFGVFHAECHKQFRPGASDISTDAVRAMVEEMLSEASRGSADIEVSEEQIKAAVRAVLEESRPTDLRIILPDERKVTVKNVHASFKKLLFMLSLKKHVYLYGPPGSGKSTGAMLAAEALGRKYGYISLNPQTPDSRLLGYKDVTTGKYHRTVFRDLYEHGGVFCIDEMDNGPASLLVTLNALLENGVGAFPDGMVQRHADFILVGTGNTTGRGGNKQFPDRRVFDAAFAERFLFLFWGYDEKMERAVALQINPRASKWIDWVQSVRAFCKENDPALVVSPRASFNICELVKHDVLSSVEIIDVALFKGIEQPRVTRILAANTLPIAA